MHIQFLGAASEVTGSCYLVEVGGLRGLVDCGMFQGGKEARRKNIQALPFHPRSLDFVLLTHAHIDHSGLLPRLVALGYRGPIFTSEATQSLLEIMLLDSAHLQEMDALWENKRRHHGRAKQAAEDLAPLYTIAQAESCLRQIKGIRKGETFSPCAGVEAMFVEAGHILGASIIQLWVDDAGVQKKLVFSGDLGQAGQLLMPNPMPIAQADILLVESTYGNRLHKSLAETEDELVAVIQRTLKAGGNVVMPAFAVGRTQEILYLLIDLVRRERLPFLNVFVDSPMATAVTRLTYQYCKALDREAQDVFAWHRQHPERIAVRFTADVEESKQLNQIRGGAVIISASGMCEAGRIKHHLLWNLPYQNSAIVITGFQAAGTLGRRLVDGAREVRLLGQSVRVKASLHTLGGLSAHADRAGLLHWLGQFQQAPQHTFVVHGEVETARMFADTLQSKLGWRSVKVPERGMRLTC